MRRRIMEGARSSRLIRQCLEMADSRMLARDEVYVLLAREALLRLEELHRNYESLRAHQAAKDLFAVDGHF
jgi:hypothetical protein